MVPVFTDGVRVGRFDVDTPVSQRELIFRKADFGPVSDQVTLDPVITEIRIPLQKLSVALPNVEIHDLNTTDLQKILHMKGAPVYSSNIERSEDPRLHATIYSWRVANVTLDQLEEIFDLDQYVPE